MKKLIIGLVLICSFLFISSVHADTPIFKMHKIGKVPARFSYSEAAETHIPVVLDYDNDGDEDIFVIDKYGIMYIMENLLK